MRNAIRVAVAALALCLGSGALSHPADAATGAYFAGYQPYASTVPTADEIFGTMTVPNATGGLLVDWLGIQNSSSLIQAGGSSAGGCFYEDWPAGPVAISTSSVRCAVGDSVFVNIAVNFYGADATAIEVQDTTTNQTEWYDVATPYECTSQCLGEASVEANSSEGPIPSTFATITFSAVNVVTNGYLFGSGTDRSLYAYYAFDVSNPTDTLNQVIWGATENAVNSSGGFTVTP